MQAYNSNYLTIHPFLMFFILILTCTVKLCNDARRCIYKKLRDFMKKVKSINTKKPGIDFFINRPAFLSIFSFQLY